MAARPPHAGPHTGRAAGSKRLRYSIQYSRMRPSARSPAQNLLAASRDPGAIKVSTRPGPRRLGRSPQRRDEGGLLPLVGSPTSEPVRRGGPELPHKSSQTRRRHHAQLQHRGQVVPGGPVLSQFSVLDAEPVALLTGEPLAARRQEPVELAGVGACRPDSYRNQVFVRNDGLDPHAQVRNWPSSHSAVPRMAVGPCTCPGAVAATSPPRGTSR